MLLLDDGQDAALHALLRVLLHGFLPVFL